MSEYTKICPQCNTRIPLSSRFCSKCGYLFSTHAREDAGPSDASPSPDLISSPISIPSKTFQGFLLADLELCIGKQYSFYMDRFRQLRHGKYTFNWGAALFSFYWLYYRQMWSIWPYAFGFTLLISVAHNMLLSAICFFCGFYMGYPQFVDHDLSFGIIYYIFYNILKMLVWGFAGDLLYWRHVRKLLTDHHCFRRAPVYDESLAQTLMTEGGTLTFWEMAMMVLIDVIPSTAINGCTTLGTKLLLKLLNFLF